MTALHSIRALAYSRCKEKISHRLGIPLRILQRLQIVILIDPNTDRPIFAHASLIATLSASFLSVLAELAERHQDLRKDPQLLWQDQLPRAEIVSEAGDLIRLCVSPNQSIKTSDLHRSSEPHHFAARSLLGY